MTADSLAILSLLLSPGAGPAAVNQCVAAAGAVKLPIGTLIETPPRALIDMLPAGLHHTAALVAKCGRDERAAAHGLLSRVARNGGRAVSSTESGWPGALSCLGNAAPPLLFFHGRGELLLEATMAAVVGARDPSAAGLGLASSCGKFFAGREIAVVSGGARGIDSQAHTSTIEGGGETVVVLPQGLLCYQAPPDVWRAVDAGRAVIVSQFAPDAPWEVHRAVTRNATISALARLACVIEPRKTGGSIRAARLALGQGKPVAAWCTTAGVGRLLETAGAVEFACAAGNLNAGLLWKLWQKALLTGGADKLPDLLEGFRPE